MTQKHTPIRPVAPNVEDPPCDRCGGDPAVCSCYEETYEELIAREPNEALKEHKRLEARAQGDRDRWLDLLEQREATRLQKEKIALLEALTTLLQAAKLAENPSFPIEQTRPALKKAVTFAEEKTIALCGTKEALIEEKDQKN